MNSVSNITRVFKDGKMKVEKVYEEIKDDDKKTRDEIEKKFDKEVFDETAYEEISDQEMHDIEIKMTEIGDSIKQARVAMNHNFEKHVKIFEEVANRLKVC